MTPSKHTLTGGFAALAIVGRVLFYVVTPIWVDYFNIHGSPLVNISNTSNTNTTNLGPLYPAHLTSHRINIIFVVVGQYAFSTLICGSILASILIFTPGKITDRDKGYPKRNFFLIGFAQGISSILINFSVSGSRTAPYLQAILSNFGIPIQFIVRFILLRKRPTCLKTVCASAVVAAEFVCLLPTIFPSLESAKQERVEGGATGAGRILWPMCMVMSMVPYAIANSIMERSVQDTCTLVENKSTTKAEDEQTKDSISASEKQVHLVYFLFWWCFFNTLTVAALFWVDFIPGFGTSTSIVEFGKTLKFNMECLFGGAECGAEVASLGWLNFMSNLIGAVAFAGLMRYSEGASFVVIVLLELISCKENGASIFTLATCASKSRYQAMRTPIVFLFWTLFSEAPFGWHPHVALSTWLSIAAIFVMLPAVVIYNLGLPSMFPCGQANAPNDEEQLLREEQAAIQDNKNS